MIAALPNPGVQKPEDSSPKHKIGSNITRLISVCFYLLYGFWDLIFKWKLRFLPNHRILEAVNLGKRLYWKLHLPLLLPTLYCSTSTLKLWGRDYRSHFTRVAPPGFSNTLWTTGLLVNIALSLLCVEEVMQSKINGPVNLVLHWNPAAASPPLLSCTKQRHIFLHLKNMGIIYKHCSMSPLGNCCKRSSTDVCKMFFNFSKGFFLSFSRGLVH